MLFGIFKLCSRIWVSVETHISTENSRDAQLCARSRTVQEFMRKLRPCYLAVLRNPFKRPGRPPENKSLALWRGPQSPVSEFFSYRAKSATAPKTVTP